VAAHQALARRRVLLALARWKFGKARSARADQNTSCSATSPSIAAFCASDSAS